MSLEQSIPSFQDDPGKPNLRAQLLQDLLPLADSIVCSAARTRGETFRVYLADEQLWELEATYKNQRRVVAEFIIEKVIKRGFDYRDNDSLIKYAGNALRIDIKSFCKRDRLTASEMPEGFDSACQRDAFDSETRRDSIARCLESRLLAEMGKMCIKALLRLALYFYYLYDQEQDKDHGGISKDGWVTLAVAAQLSKKVGEEIAGLADYSNAIDGRWGQFAAKVQRDPNNLRRTVNNNLARPINNKGELFGEFVKRLIKECSDEWP